jgi:hypothetical protein
MFSVSRTVLAVIATIAVALLIFGLLESFFPGWVAAILLGIYVVVALIKQRRPHAVG